MDKLTHYPLLLFVLSFAALSVIAMAGSWLRRRFPQTDAEHNEHLGVILAATLTLLGLIIGFSFSMAIMTSARILKRRKPTPSEPKYCARTFCRPPMLRTFASFSRNIPA